MSVPGGRVAGSLGFVASGVFAGATAGALITDGHQDKYRTRRQLTCHRKRKTIEFRCFPDSPLVTQGFSAFESGRIYFLNLKEHVTSPLSWRATEIPLVKLSNNLIFTGYENRSRISWELSKCTYQ